MKQRLESITLEQLTKWIKRNPHVTWDDSKISERLKSSDKPGFRRGKYIYFSLDTRDMNIFYIRLGGAFKEDIEINDGDPGTGNLLDELDRRLTEDGK